VERDDRRVIVVIAGLDSPRARAVEAEKLVNWAYREFETSTLFEAGEIVAEAALWIGALPTVGLTPTHDIVVTTSVTDADDVRATVRYDGPVPAPVAAGAHVADLIISAPGVADVRHPLVAAESVAEGGMAARIEAAARLALAQALTMVAPDAAP
jgi:D-alanyl-D-alanine carboxypeptidase (penicillin-binding protein 5/6)